MFVNRNISYVAIRAGAVVDSVTINDELFGGQGGELVSEWRGRDGFIVSIEGRRGEVLDLLRLRMNDGTVLEAGNGNGGSKFEPFKTGEGATLIFTLNKALFGVPVLEDMVSRFDALTVVTGASRGIGLELCKQLHAEGRRVVGVCRRMSEDLKSLNIEVIEGIDLSKPEEAAERLARGLRDRRIELLINNAGILLRDDSANAMSEQFVVNSVAPLLLAQRLSPNLIDKGGLIVFVSSKMGSIGSVSSSSIVGYRMSKAACNMGAIAHAKTLPKTCVAVVHPGVVQTDMTRSGYSLTAPESVALFRKLLPKLNNLETGKFWDVPSGDILPW